MLGKNPRAGFSVVSLFLDYKQREVYGEKPARRFFRQHFSRRRAILRRRSAGAEHDDARKMRFA
jgi:hypothetical protein